MVVVVGATVVVVVVSAFGQPVTIVKLIIPGLDLGCALKRLVQLLPRSPPPRSPPHLVVVVVGATVVVVVVSAFGQPVTIVKLTIPGLDLGCKAFYKACYSCYLEVRLQEVHYIWLSLSWAPLLWWLWSLLRRNQSIRHQGFHHIWWLWWWWW